MRDEIERACVTLALARGEEQFDRQRIKLSEPLEERVLHHHLARV